MVCLASISRLAMVRRMESSGTSSYGVSVYSALTCAALAPVASAGAAGAALSTSLATMRPCGPEPVTRDKSMPRSEAKRRASGVVNAPPGSFAGPKLRSGVRTSRKGWSGGGARRRSLRRRCCGRGAWRGTGTGDHRHHGADLGHLADAESDLAERAGAGGRHFHRSLVGLDLEQVVARLHGVAGRLKPFHDLALGDGLAELRHQDVHASPLQCSTSPTTSPTHIASREIPSCPRARLRGRGRTAWCRRTAPPDRRPGRGSSRSCRNRAFPKRACRGSGPW